jgi:uncharacterized membrane protein
MIYLVLGLVLFLGMHSVRIVADGWRSRQITRWGANGWKGIYTVVSLVGFALIVWGFSRARLHPQLLYVPPAWLKHLNALLTLAAFVLIAAAYVPRNHFKSSLGHPMLAGVKLWAFGHLLASGFLHDVVLFGAFLLWAIADFATCRRRDRTTGTTYPAGTLAGDLMTVAAGIVAWALFAFWLHAWLIGVRPLL